MISSEKEIEISLKVLGSWEWNVKVHKNEIWVWHFEHILDQLLYKELVLKILSRLVLLGIKI